METREYVVPKELHGARVDKAALTLATNVSRAQMKRAIADGAVRVNGRRRPKGAVVSEGGEERPVAKGDFVLILPGEVHQYRNTAGDRPFVIICAVPKEHE